MKKIKNFPFNSVVLMSKGWYGLTTEKNFMDLVARLIRLDNQYYISEHPSDSEISHYMLIALDEIHQHLDEDDRKCGRWLCSPLRFEEDVNRYMRLIKCTREEAIVFSVLNVMMMLSNEEIELECPRYGKGLPRYTGGKFSKLEWRPITYTFMRKNAEKFFGKQSKRNQEKVFAGVQQIISSLKEKEYKNWYFTFGCGDEKNKKNYVRIVAKSESEARERMIQEYGTQWSFDYSEEDWVIYPDTDPYWRTKAQWHGFDINRTEPITQAELYGLSEIYLGIVK